MIFSREGIDYDDGYEYYEIDFFIPGQVKYEFDISTSTGSIIECDRDYWEYDDDFEYAYLIEQAKAKKAETKQAETNQAETNEIKK